jgi:hypothetical protein
MIVFRKAVDFDSLQELLIFGLKSSLVFPKAIKGKVSTFFLAKPFSYGFTVIQGKTH